MLIHDKIIFDSLAKTAVIMRDGIYMYLASEVGDTSRPASDIVKVYRHKKEIEKAKARFEELQRIPLTINHPLRFLDLNDEASFKEGVATDPFLKQVDCFSTLGCKMGLNDKAAALYAKGIKELSCGWEGNFSKVEGQEYDYVQEFVDFNHIAILPDGRAGTTCSIIDNNLKLIEIMTGKTEKEIKSEVKDVILEEVKKTVQDAMSEISKEKDTKDTDSEEELDQDEVSKEEAKDKKSKDKKSKKAKDEESEETKDEDSEEDKKKETKDAAIIDAKAIVDAVVNDYSSIFKGIEIGAVKVADCLGKTPSQIKQVAVKNLVKKDIDLNDHAMLDAHYSVAIENYSHPSWASNNTIKDASVNDAAAEIDNINFLETK